MPPCRPRFVPRDGLTLNDQRKIFKSWCTYGCGAGAARHAIWLQRNEILVRAGSEGAPHYADAASGQSDDASIEMYEGARPWLGLDKSEYKAALRQRRAVDDWPSGLQQSLVDGRLHRLGEIIDAPAIWYRRLRHDFHRSWTRYRRGGYS